VHTDCTITILNPKFIKGYNNIFFGIGDDFYFFAEKNVAEEDLRYFESTVGEIT
jgi:hypothetical protein